MPQVAVHQAGPAVVRPGRGHRRLGRAKQIRRALLAAHAGEVLGLDRPAPDRERRGRDDLDRADPRRGRAQRSQPSRVRRGRDHACPRHAGGEHEPVPGPFREVVAEQLRDRKDGTGHPRRAGHRRDLGRGLRRQAGARDPQDHLAVPGSQQPRRAAVAQAAQDRDLGVQCRRRPVKYLCIWRSHIPGHGHVISSMSWNRMTPNQSLFSSRMICSVAAATSRTCSIVVASVISACSWASKPAILR